MIHLEMAKNGDDLPVSSKSEEIPVTFLGEGGFLQSGGDLDKATTFLGCDVCPYSNPCRIRFHQVSFILDLFT